MSTNVPLKIQMGCNFRKNTHKTFAENEFEHKNVSFRLLIIETSQKCKITSL